MNKDLDDILVSVITITYNSSIFVRDAIESVLKQKHKNIQYIIGDDCSIDETWNIINEYQDDRIVSYRNENNIGEYANRNKAIKLAKGKYTIFIDGDDIIYELGIQITLHYAFENNNVSLFVAKGYSNNIVYPFLMSSSETIQDYYFGFGLLNSGLASNFFKTEALKKYYFPTNLIQGDNYIRVHIALNSSVYFLHSAISWSRETPGQASSKLNDKIRFNESEILFEDFNEDLLKLMGDEKIEIINSVNKIRAVIISIKSYNFFKLLKEIFLIRKIDIDNYYKWKFISKKNIHFTPIKTFRGKYFN
jgi:glycosyltransferase involved in cell wall biosynthesis